MAETRQTAPILVQTGDFDLLSTADLSSIPPGALSLGRRSSTRGWLVAGLAVVAAAVVCAVLAIDRHAAVDDAARARLAYSAVEQELTTTKAEERATAAIVQSLEQDRLDLARRRGAEADAATRASALATALHDEFGRELRNGDARLTRRGSKVELTLFDWAVLDTSDGAVDVSTRGADLLTRAGLYFAKLDDGVVQIQAHTDDGPLPRGFDDRWSLTAAEAGAVAHFLEEAAELPAARLVAVGRGAAAPIPHSRAKSRRIELIVDEMR